jgi:hypothetical protein
MAITAWGEGVNACPSFPLTDRSLPAKTRITNTGRDPGYALFAVRIPASPPHLIGKTVKGQLNGRIFRVFSFTCVQQYSPLGTIGLYNYEIEVILVDVKMYLLRIFNVQ